MSTDEDRPWWRRRAANAWLRVGIPSTIIFGGGLAVRLAFRATAGAADLLVVYVVLTLLALCILAIGIYVHRRSTKAR